MGERAPYSRVYWSIIDDPKFANIYDNDAHLSAWLRLLLIADQAHPASAHLPSNVRRASVKALSAVGLVDLSGRRYRVHGLDAERGRRGLAATRTLLNGPPVGPPVGSQLDPSEVTDTEPIWTPVGPQMGLKAENETRPLSTSPLSPKGDLPSSSSPDKPKTQRQVAHRWLSDHGASVPGGWVGKNLDELVRVYHAKRLIEVWETAPAEVKTSMQFVKFAIKELEPTVLKTSSGKSSGASAETQADPDRFFQDGSQSK